MKSIISRRILVIALLSLLLPCVALGQTAKQAVEKLDDELWDAAKKGDAEAFGKNLADDYVRIDSNGAMRNKAEAVDMYKSGRLKWDSIDPKTRKIRMFGTSPL